MTRSDIQSILVATYPDELIDPMLTSYENALREYRKGNWQYFGNEVGQFVEMVRRILEYQLDSIYTPLTEKLSIFNEKVLTSYEQHDKSVSEVYRVVIPRCLYSMYCIRNKRGMIHKSQISPNKMDASLLLANMKWVLAELFRMVSTMSFEETESAVNSIMNKETTIIWNTGTVLRVLDTKMVSKDKVLCLLYMQDGATDTELQKSIEYKNSTDFKKILRDLHRDKLIEYDAPKCLLSPLGIKRAETLLL